MRIIKSFLLLTVCLTATTLLHAQEVKAEAKVEKTPAAGTNSNASNAAKLKPMNGIAPVEAAATVAETPSPLKKEETKKQSEDVKLQLATKDPNAATKNLTAEQLKTLNGVSEKPKQIAPVAAVDAQNAASPIILAPALIKEQ